MNELDILDINLTEKQKRYIAWFTVFFGIFCWILFNIFISFLDLILLIFPAILLIVPNETLRNNRNVAIISIFLMVLFFIFSIFSLFNAFNLYMMDTLFFDHFLYFIAEFMQVFMSICGLVCAFLLIKPSKSIPNTNNEPSNIKIQCSNCGAYIKKSANFCRVCGVKVNKFNNNNILFCPNCGANVDNDSRFCQECGADIYN